MADIRVDGETPSLNLTINRPARYAAPEAPIRSAGPLNDRIESRTLASGLSGAPVHALDEPAVDRRLTERRVTQSLAGVTVAVEKQAERACDENKTSRMATHTVRRRSNQNFTA
jgi:hypothetical protein